MFSTDKIGLACFLMIKGFDLVKVSSVSRGRAAFTFKLSAEEGSAQEVSYTVSDHSRFFEAFKYLRNRALRGG